MGMGRLSGLHRPVTQETHPRDVSPRKVILGSNKYKNLRHLTGLFKNLSSPSYRKTLTFVNHSKNLQEKRFLYCEKL